MIYKDEVLEMVQNFGFGLHVDYDQWEWVVVLPI